MNQGALSEVCEFLNASGWNYTVFLQTYETARTPGAPLEHLVRSALGSEIVIAKMDSVSADAVLSEILSCLRFAGDEGSGPDASAIQSERFTELVTLAIAEVKAAASQAVLIKRFDIIEGHPAYPVFWDFAFLFAAPERAKVLVGSSSD